MGEVSMTRNTTARFVKPMLENLEDRVTPTVLFGPTSVVNTMLTGVNNVLADMKTAQSHLNFDFNNAVTALTANPNGDNVRLWSHPFGIAVGDFQQILSDQASIHQMVTTDNAVLNGVAIAELINGDPIDFIILRFFPNSGFNSATQLTNVQNQADQIRTDPTVQNEVNFVFLLRAMSDPGFNAARDEITIGEEATTPSFGQ
jgi:hypothetical protein